MTIERLLAFLGYDMNTPILGRAEAVDTNAMRAAHCSPADTRVQPSRPSTTTTKAETKADDSPTDERSPSQESTSQKG